MVAKTVLTLISIATFCGFVPLSRGVGPPNDSCAGAEVIPATAGATQPYYTSETDIVLATNAVTDPESCHQFVARSIWYKFTPPVNAAYTFSTCNEPMAPTATTVSDTVMAIYTSANNCAGPFTKIDCADDSCGPGGLQSSISERPLLAGTTYYIVVWQYFDPLDPPPFAGVVQLRVTRSVPPINDTCATATEVRLNWPVTGSTAGGTNDYQLPPASPCFSGLGQTASTAPGRDVVYWFEAPRAGEYNFRVYNHSVQNDFVVYVAGSCPPSGMPVTVSNCLGAANRSSASSAEEVVCVSLAANQRVFIFVDEHGFTTGSSFTLEVSSCSREREPNNSWSTASFLACGVVGSIESAHDVDYYHLGAPAAGSRAFVLLYGEAASTTDFDLRLTSSTGTLEYDDQDNDSQFGRLSPHIAGSIMPGGPVYARVDFRGELTEPYHIYAVIQPPMAAATVESEPNDTTAEANLSGLNYYSGVLSVPTDVDVFGFTADGGDLLFLSLDGDPTRNGTPINAKLELLNEFENTLITVDDGNSTSSTNSGAGSFTAVTPRSPGEALVYRVSSTGTYYLRVSISPTAVGSVTTGDYLLSISRICHVPAAKFRSWILMTDGTMTLQLEGVPGATYRIQYSNDLQTWTSLPAQTADNNGIIQFQQMTTGSPPRFFRSVSP
jgi:hypothetical protein